MLQGLLDADQGHAGMLNLAHLIHPQPEDHQAGEVDQGVDRKGRAGERDAEYHRGRAEIAP